MRLRFFAAMVLVAGFGFLTPFARSQNGAQRAKGEHWVATWATAQQLMPAAAFGGRGGRSGSAPAPAPPPNSTGAPAPAPQTVARPPQTGRGPSPNQSNLPATLSDQTIRMPVHVSLGGDRVRIEISNMMSAQPLEIGGAHLAVYKGGGSIAPGTDRPLTFSGGAAITVPPGALAVSDPVNLGVAPMSDLAVSLYLPHDTGAPTNHTVGLRTSYISKGNAVGTDAMPEAVTTTAYAWLSSVDVAAPADAFTIVALGDSITDGYATTLDTDHAWPTLLAKRLSANRATQWSEPQK